MTDRADPLTALSRGIEQAAELLADLPGAHLATPTPCEAWSLGDLADHLVAAPRNFARMVRGEEIDWTAPTPHLASAWAEAMRASGADVLAALRAQDGADGPGPEWQCAEVAVHTWDLATALGRPTDALDPAVAEVGLAFMRVNLTAERRGPAFGPERPAPEGADAFQRIAAFAGRSE